MAVCSEIADYQWLTGDEAAVLLNDFSGGGPGVPGAPPLHTLVARLRRYLSQERAHLIAELIELRHRAREKFADADRMYFTRTALEQATDEHIAGYKAARIRRAGSVNAPIADLCCGIGGDLLALTAQGTVIAVDRNPVATHFAAANVRALVRSAEVQFQTADAAESMIDAIAAWHLDPDRRVAGRRTTSLEFCEPGIALIERFLHRTPHAAIKLAPATTVPRAWAERCELEWISRGGQCRQLVAWHGELAEQAGQRRATILSAACGLPARTLTSTPNQSVPIVHQVRDFIFDIDPAVLAAQLQGALAAEHELSALDVGPTYLTGDSSISDPALGCFRVETVLPLRMQSLQKHLRERHIGQLEIKKRGVDIVPEKLRDEMKLRGDNAATLLIAKVAGRPMAILAHRIAC